MTNKKILLWAMLLASSYAFFVLFILMNIVAFIASFIVIFFLSFKILRECFALILSLNERTRDYREFSLFTAYLLALSRSNQNLDSLLVGVYNKYSNDRKGDSKFKILLEHLLYRKLFTKAPVNIERFRRNTLSSPFVRALWSILKKLDFIDKESLSDILFLSHKLSRDLCQNAENVKTFVKSEKLKFQVLQIATAMTLSFIIKTSLILMEYPFIGVLSDPIALTFFTFTFLLFSLSFVPFLQLRTPSFKELVVSSLAFLAVLAFPVS
ncbi:MAG: hypothetical protein ACXQTU_04635 [Candidatus Nezhaarchaeales archaeon]